MILHITNGTVRYLSDLQHKHPDLMMNAVGQDAMLYRENEERDSIFDSASEYDILFQQGMLSQENTVSTHYIPVSGNGTATILGHLSDLNQELQHVKGLISYRIGQDLHKDSFIVFMQWADSSTISDFKDTDVHKDYLTPNALKKFRDSGSLFQSFISSKVYLPVEENKKNLEDLPEEEKEDY